MNKHPNATVSLVSGTGLGTLLAYGLSKVGVHLNEFQSAALAGAVGSAALFVGRNGAVGTWRFVKKVVLYGTGSHR